MHDPAAPPAEHYAARRTAGGCAVEELQTGANGQVQGIGVAGWDTGRRQWLQLWVDKDRIVTVYVGGPAADGTVVLTSEPKAGGKRWRYTYRNIRPDGVDASMPPARAKSALGRRCGRATSIGPDRRNHSKHSSLRRRRRADVFVSQPRNSNTISTISITVPSPPPTYGPPCRTRRPRANRSRMTTRMIRFTGTLRGWSASLRLPDQPTALVATSSGPRIRRRSLGLRAEAAPVPPHASMIDQRQIGGATDLQRRGPRRPTKLKTRTTMNTTMNM